MGCAHRDNEREGGEVTKTQDRQGVSVCSCLSTSQCEEGEGDGVSNACASPGEAWGVCCSPHPVDGDGAIMGARGNVVLVWSSRHTPDPAVGFTDQSQAFATS